MAADYINRPRRVSVSSVKQVPESLRDFRYGLVLFETTTPRAESASLAKSNLGAWPEVEPSTREA